MQPVLSALLFPGGGGVAQGDSIHAQNALPRRAETRDESANSKTHTHIINSLSLARSLALSLARALSLSLARARSLSLATGMDEGPVMAGMQGRLQAILKSQYVLTAHSKYTMSVPILVHRNATLRNYTRCRGLLASARFNPL